MVHRLADELGLTGRVENGAGAVRVELEGERRPGAVPAELPRRLPAQARLEPVCPCGRLPSPRPTRRALPGSGSPWMAPPHPSRSTGWRRHWWPIGPPALPAWGSCSIPAIDATVIHSSAARPAGPATALPRPNPMPASTPAGRLPALPRLPSGIRRPGQPSFPRRNDLLSRLRAPAAFLGGPRWRPPR